MSKIVHNFWMKEAVLLLERPSGGAITKLLQKPSAHADIFKTRKSNASSEVFL